jgi:hypothetical protein
MKYEPKITLTERNGNIAIWVNMPNDTQQSIWDLKPSEVNKEVIKCICSAFDEGMNAMKMLIESIPIVQFTRHDMTITKEKK